MDSDNETRHLPYGIVFVLILSAGLLGAFFPWDAMPWNQPSFEAPPTWLDNETNEDGATFNCLTDGDKICDEEYILSTAVPVLHASLVARDPKYDWEACLTLFTPQYVHTVCPDGKTIRLSAR